MTTWLLCALAFSALSAAAAHLIEAGLRPGWPRRHVWTAAIVMSVAVPGIALLTDGAWPGGLVPRSAAVDLSILDSFQGDIVATTPVVPEPAPRFEPAFVIVAGWALFSILVLAGYLAVWLRFMGAVGEWRHGRLWRQPVRVSKDTGPAVFGVRRPVIVVPAWVLEEPAAVQRMIIMHEVEHARARDHVLLALAPLAVVAMPWNVPLWWQLHRMRLAVEVDCDERVIGRGVGIREYGTLLIDMASRSKNMPAALAALAEPRTLLEKRILAMSTPTSRSRIRTGLMVAGAALLLVTAVETFTVMKPGAVAQGIPSAETPVPAAESSASETSMSEAPAGASEGTTAAVGARIGEVLSPMAADTPLVVIDGEIVSADAVNARLAGLDVVNVEMVLGEDAAARYGARGAGGVIMITTARTASVERRAGTRQGAAARGGVIEVAVPDGLPAIVLGGVAEGVRADSASVVIRAAGERGMISEAARPLYIVDGVIMSNSNLDLDAMDIESMEIVKGAAAARLYGSRAANGVIMITTKKR